MGNKEIKDFYESNPRMVSSPFGGIDGIDTELLLDVFARLDIDLSGKTVLDIGCGRGFVGELVRDGGGIYVGTDLLVSRAGFPMALGDAAALPFTENSFDAVLCFDAFEHFPEPATVAAEIARVLRPEGVFFLSAPNYANVAGLVKVVYEALGIYEKHTWAPFGRWQAQAFEHLITAGSVRRTFKAAGLGTITRTAHGDEVGLGLCPWIDHPKMPEAVQFRLQRLSARIGPAVGRIWPSASLHNFWKMCR